MAVKLGKDAVLYRNTSGNFAAPTWDDIPNVRDLTQSLEKGDADVSRRSGGGWRERLGTLKDGSVEFQMLFDEADPDFIAFRDAFLNDTLVDVLVCSGDVGTTGEQGLHAEMGVFGFGLGQELENGQTVDVVLRPSPSANAPEWFVVP